MIKVEARRIIRASIQKVFQLVSRLDAYPGVTGLWLTADVLDRRSNMLTVHYRGYFGGMPVESVQRATLQPPRRVEFKQTRGGLKTFQGQYQLKPVDGDTELSLAVEADVGIPLISEASARLVLSSYVERSLEKFKLAAERDLPRLPRRAPESPPSVPPAEVSPPQPQPAEAAPPSPSPAVRRRRRGRRRRRRSAGTGDRGDAIG